MFYPEFENIRLLQIWHVSTKLHGVISLYENLKYRETMVLLIHKISTELEHTVVHHYVYCTVYSLHVTYQVIYLVAFLDALEKLRKAAISFGMSVCLSAWNNPAPIGRIFMIFDIRVSFENLLRKFNFHKSL